MPETIRPDPPAPIARQLVERVLDPMKRTFVGKDEVIDLLGVCLVAGENLFLLGPPGTAKSALVQELGRRVEGKTFEYLLTRFTEPNELFGPFDLRKLREGDLVTNTEGMLPEASLIFLDELLNANSAILNSLLGVLNERVFRRGRETRPLPALMVVGASNRLPEDDALGALFDRFLLRVTCENVPTDRLAEVLKSGWRFGARTPEAPGIDLEDVRQLQRETAAVDLSAVVDPIAALVLRLRHAGIPVSDRRAVKLQRAVAASAVLCGRSAARQSDLWVLRHSWDTLEQQEILASLVQEALKATTPDAADHPRSRAAEAPDPDVLAKDLDALEAKLADADGRAAAADHLGVVASRCEWVRNATQRSYLQHRVNALLKKAQEKTP